MGLIHSSGSRHLELTARPSVSPAQLVGHESKNEAKSKTVSPHHTVGPKTHVMFIWHPTVHTVSFFFFSKKKIYS
ncbi:hypothetical protein PJP10_32045, partial [Mycobacterium kansasii]